MLDILSKESTPDGQQRLRFGNFEIINDDEGRPLLLGKGTFGRTYKACHRFLDTVVALKIINERYAADAGVRQRFLIEARAVAKLSHPHIARLHDFGEMEGVLHYAMEYCGGGDLSDYVAQHGPLPIQQVIEVGQQISGALKCAHTAGFIHRDLKPSNIMLTNVEGALFTKLIDFGLVRAGVPGNTRSFDDELASSDGPRFLGTPLFASPEQLREETVDFRTDLFALGISLWYLLLGGAPESGSSAEIAASRLSPESYSAKLPGDLPTPLRDIISRLIEKDRKQRFASAAEAQRAFNDCAATLGFKRTATVLPVADEEQEEETFDQAAGAPAVAPVDLETIDAELSSAFRIVTRVNEDFTGLNYVGEPTDDLGGSVFLHVLHNTLLDDPALLELFRTHVAQIVQVALPEVLTIKGLRAYSDYTVLVLERPEATDLNTVLRAQSAAHLSDARQMLESVATVCDRLATSGAPGVQLSPGRILLELQDADETRPSAGADARPLTTAKARLFPRFLAVKEAPNLANEGDDVSATMTSDMLGDPTRADNHAEHFATLLYRIVAGRNCPMAASLSPQAYVAVPGLTEQSNRILSLVIAKQLEYPSCSQMFREILSAEGVLSRGGSQGTAKSTGGSVASSAASSRTAPRRTPPPVVSSPHASVISSRQSSPPPISPPPATKSSPPPAATPPPPRMPAAATRSTAPAPKAPVEQKPLLPPAPPPPVVPVVAKSPAPTPPPAIQPATAPPAPTPVEDGLRASAVTTARAAEPPKPQPKKLDAVVPPVPPRVEPKAAAPVPPKPKTSAPVAPPAVSRPSVPAAVAPPPTPAAPIARVPLGRPERPSQEAVEKTPFNWKPVVLAAAAVLVLGFLGVGILTYTIISRRTPAVAKTEASPAPSSNQPTAAGGNTLHLRGELPAQAAFLVGSSKLPATKNGSDWDVDLAQQTPPFDLTVTAQGFDPAVVPIKSKSDIAQARTVSLTRSSGALSLSRKTACDYTLVQMKMVEPLPEDSGFVQVDSTNREKNLTSDAGTPVSLPTGVYELVLRGADEHVIAPLQPMRVSVKAGSNQAIELPRTIAGKYVGQVKSTRPGVEDTAEREVSIDAKLVTGTVTEKRDSGPVSVPLSNGHLDGRGVYVARAAFASATGGARADEDVQIKRAQNDTVDANFEGTKADKTKYALSGTLRPGAMQVAAQAPAPAAAPNNADQQAKAKADEATRTASASKSESDRQKGESSTHSERSSSGSSTRSASQPAPRQPARSEAQPAKPTKRADTHEHAFQGTAPGG